MTTIGFATIGQSPRTDLVPYLLAGLPADVTALDAGVLDGLTPEDMVALDDDGPWVHMVSLLDDCCLVRLAFDRTLLRMQRVVDDLVSRGADREMILCGAD